MANRPRKITALPKISSVSNNDLMVVEQISGNVSVTSAITGNSLVTFVFNSITEGILQMIYDTLSLSEDGYVQQISVGNAFVSSNKTYTAENLVSNTRSTAFEPLAGREFYARISGTGSGTVTLVYSMDGINFQPRVTGVDGGSPIVLSSLTYAGSPVILSGSVEKTGMLVAIKPGSVSGVVTVEFAQ